MNSYTPPDRSTYDPGWNDPPPMPSNTDASTRSARTKLNLNKRVAFPLQAAGNVSTSASINSNIKTTAEGLPLPYSTAKYQPPAMISQFQPLAANVPAQPILLPPPMSCTQVTTEPVSDALLLPSLATLAQSSVESAESDLTAGRDYCYSTFCQLLEAMATKNDSAKVTEIRKRLDVLNEMWLEHKFDEATQRDLYQLAKALGAHDIVQAKEQHRLLVTHHMNASTQWATALRQIILSLESDETKIDNETGPAVLPDNEINVVQFLNVSSTPHVIEANEPFTETTCNPNVSMPIKPYVLNDVNVFDGKARIPEAEQDDASSTKSKPGRFGRILHL